MPRLKLKRFRVKPPSPAVLAHYVHDYEGHTLHHHPERLTPLTSEALFGNAQPFVLDIGCGRGEFLCKLAQERPHVNMLGLEWHWKSTYDTVNKLHAAGLDNVCLVRGDARQVLRHMPDAVAQEAFLLFPPPRPDPREAKADLLNPAQMQTYHRVLQPGARFHFVTDNDAYFRQKVAQLAASALFTVLDMAEGFEGGHTDFQRRWEQWGITSKRAVFARAGAAGK